MKLSKLVAYRNRLKKFNMLDIQRRVDTDLKNILYLIESQSIDLDNLSSTLSYDQEIVIQSLEGFNTHLEQLKQKIQDQITELEKNYFQQNYRSYEEEIAKNLEYDYYHELRNDDFYLDQYGITRQGVNPAKVKYRQDTTQRISERRLEINDATKELLNIRVMRHNKWQHAGMIIHPCAESFVENLVGADPLYLVDEQHELLAPTLDMFNDAYKSRLRTYVIQESSKDELFKKLPDSQFGFVLAYNYFNYRPIEVIKKYLQEIYKKLKPGGTLLMTFNDCDNEPGVILAEENFAAYTPNGLIKQLIDNLGFVLTFEYNNDSNSTWIEVQKPGTLESLKGGQTLAKILPK